MPQDAVVLLTALAVAGLCAFLLPALLAPIRLKRRHFITIETTYIPAELPHLELKRTIEDLEELGFQLIGHWRLAGHSIAKGHLSLLEHPQTLDAVKVLRTAAGRNRSITLLFHTRFDDGSEFVTANNRRTTGSSPLPGMTSLWVPEIRDCRELHRLHRGALDSFAAGKKRIAIGANPEVYLREGQARVFAHYVDQGLYYWSEADVEIRPTWNGAIRLTWRQLWPIRPILDWRRRLRTRQILNELGVSMQV